VVPQPNKAAMVFLLYAKPSLFCLIRDFPRESVADFPGFLADVFLEVREGVDRLAGSAHGPIEYCHASEKG
jgi:hypothetical protein